MKDATFSNMKNGIVIKYYFMLSSDLWLPTLIYCYNNWYAGYAPQFYSLIRRPTHGYDFDFERLRFSSAALFFSIPRLPKSFVDYSPYYSSNRRIRVCQTLTSIKNSITIFHRRPQFI